MKNFIGKIPDSLEESAFIDGASEFTILARIITPLCMPAIATFALFHAVGHWNSYFDAVIYITKQSLWPLMVLLREVVVEGALDMAVETDFQDDAALITPFNMRMALIVATILPIMSVYPFAQKYFMKGLTLGSVKG